MHTQFWRTLQVEAPRALALCLDYFQQHYPGQASAQLLHPKSVLNYLHTQGYQLDISQFGIPNRQDWYYEVIADGKLLQHQRGFPTQALATQAAFRYTFLALEAA